MKRPRVLHIVKDRDTADRLNSHAFKGCESVIAVSRDFPDAMRGMELTRVIVHCPINGELFDSVLNPAMRDKEVCAELHGDMA